VVILTIMFHFCHMNFSAIYERFGISSVKSAINKNMEKIIKVARDLLINRDTIKIPKYYHP
ncbi:MAG: hypothetical protein OXI94_15310, partial [Gemmatimonadota bacterium]|nr:hypothetical protein [Gemmatimonadota bacterium]